MGRHRHPPTKKLAHGRPLSFDFVNIIDLEEGFSCRVLKKTAHAVSAFLSSPESALNRRHPERRFRLQLDESGALRVSRIEDRSPRPAADILADATEESSFPYPGEEGKPFFVTLRRNDPFAKHCESVGHGSHSSRLWLIKIDNGRRAAVDFAGILDDHGIPCRTRRAT